MPPSLLQIVDSALASAVARSGPHLVCRPGCSQCCHGVFPIAQQDAARLRDGLAHLTLADPAAALALRARVAASLNRLDPFFPGDLPSGILADDPESVILFEEFANHEPCPVLDPLTQTCTLYAHRPILCRTFGPPMRIPPNDDDPDQPASDQPEVSLGTCELCFTQASTAEIAAAELDPAIPHLEAESNARFDAIHNTHGETLIAYALREALP